MKRSRSVEVEARQELINLTDTLYLVGEKISRVGKEIIFRPNNLTIPRYKILRALAESARGTLPTSTVQELLKVTSGNLTGRWDGLEASREPDRLWGSSSI